MIRAGTSLSAICLLALLGAGEAAARTRYVAMNGVDPLPNGVLDACGASFPCRTLNHAIEASQPGDTIQVGPRRYDGFAEAPPVGCECLILVDKQLTIVSRDGAYTTLIDAGGADLDAVRIDAGNVVFGTRKHGFTVSGSGAGRSGLFSTAAGLEVAGNVAYANWVISRVACLFPGFDGVPDSKVWHDHLPVQVPVSAVSRPRSPFDGVSR